MFQKSGDFKFSTMSEQIPGSTPKVDSTKFELSKVKPIKYVQRRKENPNEEYHKLLNRIFTYLAITALVCILLIILKGLF